jgi:hypothetical protein
MSYNCPDEPAPLDQFAQCYECGRVARPPYPRTWKRSPQGLILCGTCASPLRPGNSSFFAEHAPWESLMLAARQHAVGRVAAIAKTEQTLD